MGNSMKQPKRGSAMSLFLRKLRLILLETIYILDDILKLENQILLIV